MLKRKNKFKKIYKKVKIKFKIYKKQVMLLLFLVIIVFFINFLYNLYINNPKNIINKVYFDKNIINNPNYNKLIKFTTKAFSGLNSSKEKIFKYNSTINQIKNNFQYVKNINVEQISSNEIKINYIFQNPNLIFKYSGENILVYNKKYMYKFKNLSGFNFSGVNIVYLPKYIKTSNNIFWRNSYKKILNYIEKIKKYFPKSKIFYLPGGEILEIQTSGIKIWILLEKDIEKQLNKFTLVRKKLKLEEVKFIDLGSLENSIFIK